MTEACRSTSMPVGGLDTVGQSAARQARLQYDAMRICQHEVDADDQRCESCLGSFGAIHAQHTFDEGRGRFGFGHLLAAAL